MSRFAGTLILALAALVASIGLRNLTRTEPDPVVRPGVLAIPETVPPSLSERPTLRGGTLKLYVHSRNVPASGARVTVIEEGGSGRMEFVLPADGRQSLFRIPAADYAVQVRLAGYGLVDRHATIESDRETDLTIELKYGGTVEGIVCDKAGKPVAGARVSLLDPRTRLFLHPDLQSATDTEGRFRFENVPVGTLMVYCRHPRFMPSLKEGLILAVPASTLRTDFVLDTGWSLRGYVHQEAGAPLQRANVFAINEVSCAATTDAEGRFAIDGLGPGPLKLTVWASGYAPRCLEGLSPSTREVDVTLVPGAVVDGSIDTANPPMRFSVTLRKLTDPSLLTRRPLTRTFESRQGSFRFADLEAGTYVIEVSAAGYRTLDIPELTLAAETTRSVHIRLSPVD